MVEAVPTQPYDAIENLRELLTCYPKVQRRRQILNNFFTSCGLGLASVASPIILGTHDHVFIEDDPELREEVAQGNLEKRNLYS